MKLIINIFMLLLKIILFAKLLKLVRGQNNFSIDYENNQFLRDGKPFRYISGDFEYFKIPAVLWEDRLIKYKAAGLNAVQTYINWNLHEPERGEYHFDGDLDFEAFFKLAQKMGFVVVLRPGPFINAEVDMGGLPYWLLTINKDMKLRTNDAQYMAEVERWLSVLMPKLKPHLYQNNGSIIMVQVENEYAYWSSCDLTYISRLRDLFRHYLGNDIILFSTDGIWHFDCSIYEGVYATIDFGTKDDPKVHFGRLREHSPKGPLVNSEFYTGWINRWEMPAEHVETKTFADSLDLLLSMNVSVNLYPMCGGTLFGFMSGSSHVNESDFHPVVTSYEFDGPITEAGDLNDKYFAIQKVISKYVTLPFSPNIVSVAPKMQLSSITLKPIATIFDSQLAGSAVSAVWPQTFEQLRLREGFALYSTNITDTTLTAVNLTVSGLGDRAQVFINQEYRGTLSLTHQHFQLTLSNTTNGSRLDILVENQGRYAFRDIEQLKGITKNVTLGTKVLANWEHRLLFSNWTKAVQLIEARNASSSAIDRIPTFFSSNFQLPNDSSLPLDSFLRLDGWGKGVAFLNGFNLGRYWPLAGPQVTLYAPAHLFRPFPQFNALTVFELEKNPCARNSSECVVRFVRDHVLNGTVAND